MQLPQPERLLSGRGRREDFDYYLAAGIDREMPHKMQRGNSCLSTAFEILTMLDVGTEPRDTVHKLIHRAARHRMALLPLYVYHAFAGKCAPVTPMSVWDMVEDGARRHPNQWHSLLCCLETGREMNHAVALHVAYAQIGEHRRIAYLMNDPSLACPVLFTAPEWHSDARGLLRARGTHEYAYLPHAAIVTELYQVSFTGNRHRESELRPMPRLEQETI